MKQFLRLICVFGLALCEPIEAMPSLKIECTTDAKILLGGRAVQAPLRNWPYEGLERQKLIQTGIHFVQSLDGHEFFLNHIRSREPELFELIGALLTHNRMGGKYNANAFIGGGPFRETPSLDQVRSQIGKLILTIPEPRSWWASVLGKFNVEAYFTQLRNGLEIVFYNLNLGSKEVLTRSDGFLGVILSNIKLGQNFFFQDTQGQRKLFRLQSINFDSGQLLLIQLDSGGDYSVKRTHQKIVSVADFYEGIRYEDRRGLIFKNIKGLPPREWVTPESEMFSIESKFISPERQIFYAISGNPNPSESVLKKLNYPPNSEADLKNRLRVWKLTNGYLEGRGFLIDKFLDLFPSLAQKLNWSRLEGVNRWQITSVYDLVDQLNLWDLPIKMITTPRFRGNSSEEYLRNLCLEKTYSFGEQGTPFFHDQMLHLVGLVLLPPDVLESFILRGKNILHALDAARLIDPKSETSVQLEKTAHSFAQFFDDQNYRIFEDFISADSKNRKSDGSFDKLKFLETIKTRFLSFARFSADPTAELSEASKEKNLGQAQDLELQWREKWRPHVERILGSDFEKYFD